MRQRAVEDESWQPRSKSLELLAGDERWAEHPETLALPERIKESIHTTETPQTRGWAACHYFRSVNSSDPLADAKQRVFSQDADGIGPYLDPREPVSDEHLAKVARVADLSDEQREAMVEQMNAALGWDIRIGLTE
ncbi:MAG: hypothetical protein HQ518_00890 [Rhodopirellula sp.]|nr:hypothetical protein [Rhodopirellula sp.]